MGIRQVQSFAHLASFFHGQNILRTAMYSFLVKKGQDRSTAQEYSPPAKKIVTVITVDNEGNEQQDMYLSTPAPKGQSSRTRNSLTPISAEHCQYKDKLRGGRSGSTSPVSLSIANDLAGNLESTRKRRTKENIEDTEECSYNPTEKRASIEGLQECETQHDGKDMKLGGTRLKRKLPFPNTQEKLDELKAVVQSERCFVEDKLFRLFDKEPLRQYLSGQVDCKDLRVSVCISIEGSSAPLSELASHVLSKHREGFETTINLTAIRNMILSLADRVTHRNEIPFDADVLEDTDPLYWWSWEVKDVKPFGIPLKRKFGEFRKIRRKMAERFTASEHLGLEIDKYDEFTSLANSDGLEKVTMLLSAFNNSTPLLGLFDKFEKWKGEQAEKGSQDPNPSCSVSNSKEEKELQRLKVQAEKVKHREQRLAERKRMREQQDAEREEKRKKREEKKAKQEAEQALKNQESQRKAEERQRKIAETLRLEELKSKAKMKQAQVMAKFLAQSESAKEDGQNCLTTAAENVDDDLVNIDNKYGEMKFLPLSPKSQTCIISHYGKPITKSVDESMLVEWKESTLLEENMAKWKKIGNQNPYNNRKSSNLQQRTRRQLNFLDGNEDDIRQEDCCGRSRILLQFQENSRPAYFGTFSKRSCMISGRKPFAKDVGKVEDYEYDSGDDWDEPEDGESLKGSDEEIDDEEKEADEEEDGFVVPDGYLSADEADYLDPADKDSAASPKSRLQCNPDEEKTARSFAESNALLQFTSMTERAKQCGKPIVITDEGILQAFPVCIMEDSPLESNESSEADDSQMGEDEALDDSKNSRQPKEFPETLHREIILRLNNEAVKSAAKFADELISSCKDFVVTKGDVHKHVREVAEYSKPNSRWEVKSEYLKNLGLERQNVAKTPTKKSLQAKPLSKGSISITSFFGKNAKEKGASSLVNGMEDDKTNKTEESTSSAAAGSITGPEQEAETSKSVTIDQALLLSSPTSNSLQDIINRNLSHEEIFAFHQFDKDLIDNIIHRVNPAMTECLVMALGNQSLSFGDRLRVIYAVANLTHCAREHLRQEKEDSGFLQILRVVYQSSSVVDTLRMLREENNIELVRGLFLLLNILLHDPLDKDSKIQSYQADLAQELISLEWCDAIVGGLSHQDDQIVARAACTSYHLLLLARHETKLASGPTRWHVLKEVTESLRKPLVAIRKYCLKCLELLLSTEDEFDKLGIFSDLQKHLQTLQCSDTREDIISLSNEVATKCSQQLKRFAGQVIS